MKLYIWVDTSNEFMLPIFVTPNISEMAEKSGCKVDSIRSSASKHKHGVRPISKFEVVEVEDD